MNLNVMSVLYALMIFVPLELMQNVYRIARLTGWEIGTVNILIGFTLMVDMIGGSMLLYYLTNKWQANFWTMILWFPYFVLFICIYAKLFPITYGGDTPNPVTGLLAIGGLIAYPFYILILNVVARANRGE
ncbi:hypothetical protein SAMN05880501_104260 [Ureibacillus xyleni]|uniref:Uncharacterized protein n=1 Tax=Ureibacillus xyleni TaxID=614648 RepID=A0A285SEP6_9BACL|nr:hypothetical protein [Ureibacillus xyleni]SOC06367.1 hypothetical protein SAMN05880501_104260 [Ureibacillus xyleni]